MISVVICAKNEPGIAHCIRLVERADLVSQIVVVAADRRTASVASSVTCRQARIVALSDLGNLSADRQLGFMLASGDIVAYIDADHRVGDGTFRRLLVDMVDRGADVLQARLDIASRSWWNRSESAFLRMTMVPGAHDMVGVAPSLFRREVLERVPFASDQTIDDTDLMYRIHRDTGFVTAVSEEIVTCLHAPRLWDYIAKWRWYGRGDRQFCRTHPERRRSMLFHLLVRYPFVYPVRALRTGHLRAIPYAIAQGLVRASCFIKS